MTVVTLLGLSPQWNTASDVGNTLDLVECFGAGASSTTGNGVVGSGGSGGGAYAASANIPAVPGVPVPISVGTTSNGADGTPSTFGGRSIPSCIVGADGGKHGGYNADTSSMAGLGGLVSNSVGQIVFPGGNGGLGGGTVGVEGGGGGGGGGAAGSNGPGQNGSPGQGAGEGAAGGNGGAGNGGLNAGGTGGTAGGNGTAPANAQVAAGGSGGGSYPTGSSGNLSSNRTDNGGTGGASSGGNSGRGGPGVIRITYTPGLYLITGAGSGQGPQSVYERANEDFWEARNAHLARFAPAKLPKAFTEAHPEAKNVVNRYNRIALTIPRLPNVAALMKIGQILLDLALQIETYRVKSDEEALLALIL